jgi:hypothetical protein
MPKNAKYGGRTKGVSNKVSAELKEVLNEYCLNEFQYLNANKERLTLSERLRMFRMMPVLRAKLRYLLLFLLRMNKIYFHK